MRRWLVLLGIIAAVTLPSSGQAPVQPKPIPLSICSLLRDRSQYVGKAVVLSGAVEASIHGSVLYDPKCGGLFLIGLSEMQSPLGKRLYEAVLARMGGYDAQIRTTVEGVFNVRTTLDSKKIRRLELVQVDDLRLTGAQQELPTGFDAMSGFRGPLPSALTH